MHSSQVPSDRKIRAIIFDMDNTLFDFVAAKQHACQEVVKYLNRDDWEALFNCFINSPHGFESHENIKDYFDLCGLLQGCDTRILSCSCSFSSEEVSPRQAPDAPVNGPLPGGRPPTGKSTPPAPPSPDAPGRGRIDLSCGVPFTREVHSTEPSSRVASPHDRDNRPGDSSISPETPPTGPSARVRDNLLADKSLYCNEAFSLCCGIYEAEKVRVLEPYPGTRETLAELKRRSFPLAIVTDAHNGNALARLRKTGLSEFFDYVISYDMTGAKKPAPDAFLLALKKLGTLPSETLLIGDSIRRDIAPAKELGMITAYAAYGDRNIRSRDPPDVRADIVLRDIRELVRLVE